MPPVTAALATIAGALDRLDQRRHVQPASLELSRPDEVWVAQIMADPLPIPVTGVGITHEHALQDLLCELDALDWRRVKR